MTAELNAICCTFEVILAGVFSVHTTLLCRFAVPPTVHLGNFWTRGKTSWYCRAEVPYHVESDNENAGMGLGEITGRREVIIQQ